MLLNNFFFIEGIESSGNVIKTSLRIDKNHSIFKGHFPDNPVVPGVCMMQIIKEILEKHTNKALFLDESLNVKFLAVLDPRVNDVIESQITIDENNEESIKINGTLFAGPVTFFKLKASLKFI